MGGENLITVHNEGTLTTQNNGLGTLPDAISATVTEERNGAFTFDMQYPIDGRRAEYLTENKVIKTDAGHVLKDQLFVIKTITPKLSEDGTLIKEVYAEHISYLTNDITLKPTVNVGTGNAQSALNTWKASLTEPTTITVFSDVTAVSSTKWTIDKVANAREALGGVEGSILDNWGGEYMFDNLNIKLLQHRGTTAEAVLAYGRNITTFSQEQSIAETYTSVYPYAIFSNGNDEKLVTIDEYIVDSKYLDNYPNRKIKTVDFSSEFENTQIGTKPSDDTSDTVYISEDEVKQKLKKYANKFISNNNIGVPKVSIEVEFVDLQKAGLAPLEKLDLCDEVPIRFEKLGINTTAKISRIVWNCLTDTYDSLELGDITPTLGDKINESIYNSSQAIIWAQKAKDISYGAQQAANGSNTIFRCDASQGKPTAKKVGDLYYEKDGEFVNMYQWDGTQWVLISSTKDIHDVSEKVDDAVSGVEDAKQNAQNAVDKAEQAIADAGLASDKANKADEIAQSAQENAQNAINNAQSAIANAQNAISNAQKAQETANNAISNAQNAINQASSAGTIANAVKQDVINLKGGSTATIAELENGLALKLERKDLNGYATESWTTTQITASADGLSAELSKVSGKVDSLQIGGRNLLQRKWFFENRWQGQVIETEYLGKKCLKYNHRVVS